MLNFSAVFAAEGAADFFNRIFDQSQEQANLNYISPGMVLLCIGCAIALGIGIGLVYMFTHRRIGYSQSYVIAMPMLSALVATIISMMCVLANSSVGVTAAISLTGAFSLVRFRSAPGDPRDIAYVFFAMVMGTVCGIGFLAYAVLIFVILAALLMILSVAGFAAPKTEDMTLKITIPENLNYNGLFDKVLDQYTTVWRLRRVKTTDFGTLFDLIYSIRIKTDADQKKFIDEVRALNGNLNVTLVLYRYDDQIYNTADK